MDDFQLYAQLLLLLIFMLFSGARSLWTHRNYINPKSMVVILNFMKFSMTNLDKDEKSKLNLDDFSKIERTKLPEKYQFLLEKFDVFSEKKPLLYKELLPEGAEEIETDKKMYDYIIEGIGFIIATVPLQILTFLLAPLMTFFNYSDTIEKSKNLNWNILVHPSDRSLTLMQSLYGIIAIVTSLILFSIIFNKSIGNYTIFFILLLPVVIFLIQFYVLIQNQKKFINKWSEVFDFLMQKATIENDHDLYNKAFNCSITLNSYSSIPLSELNKTYLLIGAIAQLLITYGSKMFHIF